MKVKGFDVLIWCIFFFSILSCSKDLTMEDRLPSETEVVNGISIAWKEGVTEKNRKLVRDLLNDMVFVQGGVFLMGSNLAYDENARKNEAPAHYVNLSSYYILAHEMPKDYVANVYEGKELSKYRSYTYFEWEATLRMLSAYSNIEFSFPSEAQWEYAAIGGNKSQGYSYPGAGAHKMVWTNSEIAPGCELPNELGLYNMGDLYGEWCKDLYCEYSNSIMPTDPCNSVQNSLSIEHVVRGGCSLSKGVYKNWNSTIESSFSYGVNKLGTSDSSSDARMCRSKSRSYEYAHIANSLVGCRPVINIK